MEKNDAVKTTLEALLKSDKPTLELVIREGVAMPVFPDKKVSISGSIFAPGNFIEKRGKDYIGKENTVHVVFSRKDKEIVLTCGECDEINKVIIGKLTLNEDLSLFGINKQKQYLIADLKSFLKLNKMFFSDSEQAMKIISNLEKFRVSANKQIEQGNDGRGNKIDSYEVKTDTNLELDFNLIMPVYIGQEAKKFKVEIGFDVRDKSISLWLESPELRQIEIEERDKIINAEILKFSDYVVIER